MSEQFEIRRAERKQARLRLALAAASGGGKTASALLLAKGIVEELLSRGLLSGTVEGKIGLIDTERRSAELYAHMVPFDVLPLDPPYSPDRYIAAMDALERTGITVMIIDSISHAWTGEGGVLALMNSIDQNERWRAFGTQINPVQDRFVDRILRSSCHVIATMRSKTAWVVEQVEKSTRSGGVRVVNQPKRIGMAPVQRPGIEYEFTTLLDLDSQTHLARAVKNRCPVFTDQPVLLTAEVGRALASWMQEGAPEAVPPAGGTAEERLQARAEGALRAFERAETVPDLARVFAETQREIRAHTGVVPSAVLVPLLESVIAAKDARKAALGGDRVHRTIDTGAGEPPPPEPSAAGPMEACVTTQEETELRGLIGAAKVPLAEVLERYALVKLGLLRRDALPACRAWLEERRAALKPEPAMAGVDHFADLEDDLPWKD